MMTKFPRFERFWWRKALLVGTGTLFALDGCDPTVKSTILGGMETAATGLADTFITAFFQKLASGDSTTTTMLRTVEDLARMLA